MEKVAVPEVNGAQVSGITSQFSQRCHNINQLDILSGVNCVNVAAALRQVSQNTLKFILLCANLKNK